VNSGRIREFSNRTLNYEAPINLYYISPLTQKKSDIFFVMEATWSA